MGSRRKFRREDSDDRSDSDSPTHRSKRSRHYRKTTGEESGSKTRRIEDQVNLEADMVARIASRVKTGVETAMQSEEVQKRIEERLRVERARLEDKVTAQLNSEKAALLAKKREQQLERKRKQEDLERILQDNRRKVEEAQQRAAEERRRREEGGMAGFSDPTKSKQRPQGIRVVES